MFNSRAVNKIQCYYNASVNVTTICYSHVNLTRENFRMNYVRLRLSATLVSMKLTWSWHCFTNDISATIHIISVTIKRNNRPD